jgi:hypothetical protein
MRHPTTGSHGSGAWSFERDDIGVHGLGLNEKSRFQIILVSGMSQRDKRAQARRQAGIMMLQNYCAIHQQV